jgi:hypothetical protein
MKPAFRDCLSFPSSGFQGTQDYLETLNMGQTNSPETLVSYKKNDAR